MADIRAGIANRTSLPGARLPSVRAPARALRVSVSAVVEACDGLGDAGAIGARPWLVPIHV
ncbi:GntR family transcriptional regulator [Xanthomonas sp. LMG 12461]|uniref:GntR family transcriptional regulator n=1 Tax=Xanthomonas sp. LMG 12461 TaxID=2014543 RepID=UPI0021068F88|nr:GntR family transcriptional regulator [Xanthomonas sp. LMG 12461]